MNRYILTIAMILSSICFMQSETNACDKKPIAWVNDYTRNQLVGKYTGNTYDGKEVFLDGSYSYDPDNEGEDPGITYWYWEVWKWNGWTHVYYGYSYYGEYEYIWFNEPGFYQIRLWVLDDDDPDPEDEEYLYWSETYDYILVTVCEADMDNTYYYGVNTNLTYSILPDPPPLFYTPDYVALTIFDSQYQKVFELIDDSPYAQTGNDLFLGPNKTYIWDGKGNCGSYSGQYLTVGQYYVVPETGKKNYYGPGEYDYEYGWANVWSTLTVNPIPINLHLIYWKDLGNGELFFEYQWDSTTGDKDDLWNCLLAEKVDYPGSVSPYVWPSPPWPTGTGTTDPYYNQFGFGNQSKITDTHLTGNPTTPYQAESFTAYQVFLFHCNPWMGSALVWDNWALLLDNGEIVRSVTGPNPWKYTVTQNGYSAEINPLP